MPMNDLPPLVRPYAFHGIDITHRTGTDNAYGVCPFCLREGKFSVKVETGQWRCVVCNEGTTSPEGKRKVFRGGNVFSFLRILHNEALENTSEEDYESLAHTRGYLSSESVKSWGLARSPITGEWLVPGYDRDKDRRWKLMQLYRWAEAPSGKRYFCWPTPGCEHRLFSPLSYPKGYSDLHVCEGVWDGIALWEILRRSRRTRDGELTYTSDPARSLAATARVVAIPSATVFHERWAEVTAGKACSIWMHNDYPHKNEKTGQDVPPAGYLGCQRISELLSVSETPPASLSYLCWGEAGYDASLKSGYDIRDDLSEFSSLHDRVEAFSLLLDRLRPVPSEWIPCKDPSSPDGQVILACKPCTDWKTLQTAWRKAMKWTEGLEGGLAFALAVIVSTPQVGDQLWGKIIGPPSCGKSVICEALSVARKYIEPRSSIRGFHSGYKSDKDGSEDHSLIARARGKTLVTKDGDSLLSIPNLRQLLAEARDIYDTVSRAHYRHGMSRNYEGDRMTWLLCGTESLRELDASELGERFLDYVICHEMEEELEHSIGRRVILTALRQVQYQANGKAETREGPEITLAKQLTGGYINYLRENAERLLHDVSEASGGYDGDNPTLDRIIRLAQFVSFARARPSKTQEEKAQRELSFRLINQHARLAACLAIVLNKTTIDDASLLRIVYKVGMDTARGRSLNYIKALYRKGLEGAETVQVATWVVEDEKKAKEYLSFLLKIGVVETYTPDYGHGIRGTGRWRLTPRLRTLYHSITGDPLPAEATESEDE